MQSPRRIAVGQRFYVLQPMGTAYSTPIPGGSPRAARAAHARLAAGRGRIRIDRRHGRVSIALFFSEGEAQRITSFIRSGKGHGALLQALTKAYRELDPGALGASVLREDEQLIEDLAPGVSRLTRLPALLARRLRGWILPTLAKWAAANAEAFVRAAASPESGVTVKISLTRVHGLGQSAAALRVPVSAPVTAITVKPGRH
jgi:hypothetical protein